MRGVMGKCFAAVACAAIVAVNCGKHVYGAEPVDPPLPLNIFKKLSTGAKQTVVVYGTSLSIHGAWALEVQKYFDAKFPGQVTFINAAQAGVDSKWGVANLKKRVLDKKPDLVFIEFSVNDSAPKNHVSLEKSKDNLDSMVTSLRQQSASIDIVLQTMDQAWDSPTNTAKKYGSDRPDMASYYDVYRQYAKEHGLPCVDNYPKWIEIQEQDPVQYQKMVPDGIHPNSEASIAVTWPAVQQVFEQARTATGSEKGATTTSSKSP